MAGIYGEVTTETVEDWQKFDAGVARYAWLKTPLRKLHDQDSEEAHHAIQLQKNRLLSVLIFLFLLAKVLRFDRTIGLTPENVADQWFTKDDLKTFLKYARRDTPLIKRLFGVNPHSTDNPVIILRGILKHFGLTVESNRVRIDGERIYQYRIAPDRLAQVHQWAEKYSDQPGKDCAKIERFKCLDWRQKAKKWKKKVSQKSL